jgi:hypothetical protein
LTDVTQINERVDRLVGVGEAAHPIEHHELEHTQAAGELLGKHDEVGGVFGFGRGDDDRAVAQALPDFRHCGVGWIGAGAQAGGGIEERRFVAQYAAEPLDQPRQCIDGGDHDATGLVAAQLAQCEDQRIEFGQALAARRDQREENALAVEFLEIEGLLGELWRALTSEARWSCSVFVQLGPACPCGIR